MRPKCCPTRAVIFLSPELDRLSDLTYPVPFPDVELEPFRVAGYSTEAPITHSVAGSTQEFEKYLHSESVNICQ